MSTTNVKDLVISLESFSLNFKSQADKVIRTKSKLSFSQLQILLSTTHKGCISQDDISKMLGLSQPSISKQLSKMLATNLIEAENLDRRSWTIKLTQKGQKEFNHAFEAYNDFCLSTFGILSSDEIEGMLFSIRKISQNFIKL